MAQKYSTALVNLLTGGRSLRSILDNFVLQIYSGAAPADADAAPTGVLLCTVSLNSGAAGATAEPSYDNWYFTIAVGVVGGQTVIPVISVDGITGSIPYTVYGTADTSEAKKAARVANAINRAGRPVKAIGVSGPSGPSGMVSVHPVVRGLTMSVSDGGGNYAITQVQLAVASRPNTLQFGPPSAGIISKLSGDTWTGVNITNGVAGYFRLVLPDDTLAADVTPFTQPRVQGSVGTSGADLNLDSVQFVTSAVTTITGFSIQEPTSA
jgi:hypothetical protein